MRCARRRSSRRSERESTGLARGRGQNEAPDHAGKIEWPTAQAVPKSGSGRHFDRRSIARDEIDLEGNELVVVRVGHTDTDDAACLFDGILPGLGADVDTFGTDYRHVFKPDEAENAVQMG